jgi:hypothetical protein
MKIYKTKEFAKDARKLGISDSSLCKVIVEIELGKAHAALGGEVFKQRLARPGSGKSGGFRTILVFRQSHRSVFIDVFAKNDRETISDRALTSFKQAAEAMLGLDEEMVSKLLINQIWIEIDRDEKDISN